MYLPLSLVGITADKSPMPCRITEEDVDELSQDNGLYMPIDLKSKYAKRSSVQYLVSSCASFFMCFVCLFCSLLHCDHALHMTCKCFLHGDVRIATCIEALKF